MHLLLRAMEHMMGPCAELSESREEYLWWEALHKLEYAYRRFDMLGSKYLQPVTEELEARLDITMDELIDVYCKWFGSHWGDDEDWKQWVEDEDVDVWAVVHAYVRSIQGILECGDPSIIRNYLEYEKDWDGDEETGILWFDDPDANLDEPVNISEAGEEKDITPRQMAVLFEIVDETPEDRAAIEKKGRRVDSYYLSEDVTRYLESQFENMFDSAEDAAEYLFTDQGYEVFKMLMELQGQDKKSLSDRLVLMTRALNVAHHGGFMAQYAHITNQELNDLNYIKVTPPSEVALYRAGGEEAWLYRMVSPLLGQYAEPGSSRDRTG